jgi:hypothetical protein
VARIGSALVDGTTVFSMVLEGRVDYDLFLATLQVSPEVPLVREGDLVEMQVERDPHPCSCSGTVYIVTGLHLPDVVKIATLPKVLI